MADETNLNTSEEEVGGNSLGRLWNSLRPPARAAIIIIGALAFFVAVYLSVSQVTPTEMEVLFHRMDPTQALGVADKLDEMSVAYELEDDGSTILVPASQRDRLRLSLSPDLYSQGIGFALFEEGGLVASDFERRVQFQIALEEELRRTITSIDAVEQARVHLVITEEGLFIRDRLEPSASVLVTLGPLASLSDSQVRGILSLVAGSVEGLKPENVTIVDSDGNILYDAFASMDGMTVSNAVEGNMNMKRQFETELERRLRSILEQVYGPGKAVAMVTAELDFDTRESTILFFDQNPVSRSTHRIDERSENINPAGEEVGEPNIPGQAAVIGGGGESSYERVEEIVNYEVSETREYIAAAPGNVVRLSTAVIIDGENNDPFLEERVIELVNSAIGFDEARGDTVSVQLIPFETDWIIDPDVVPPLIPEEGTLPLLWIIIGAAALLMLILLFFIMSRRKARLREEEEELDALSLEEEMAERIKTQAEKVEPGETESKAKEIRRLATEEPESVAGLLKTWLLED